MMTETSGRGVHTHIHTPAADTMFALAQMCETTIEVSDDKGSSVCRLLHGMKRNLLHTPQRHKQTVGMATRRNKNMPKFRCIKILEVLEQQQHEGAQRGSNS